MRVFQSLFLRVAVCLIRVLYGDLRFTSFPWPILSFGRSALLSPLLKKMTRPLVSFIQAKSLTPGEAFPLVCDDGGFSKQAFFTSSDDRECSTPIFRYLPGTLYRPSIG